MAIQSVVEDTDLTWLRFIELCQLTKTSDQMLAQVYCDFFTTLSSIFSELRQVDSSITNAWIQLWTNFEDDDFQEIKSELSPVLTSMFLGQFQSIHLTSPAMRAIASDLDRAALAMTYVRGFLIYALAMFDKLGADAIRHCFRSRISNELEPMEISNELEPMESATKRYFTPDCPKCGSRTVLRYSKKGYNPGKPFWGCSTFPNCRGTLSIFRSADQYPQFSYTEDDESTGDWFIEYMNDIYGPDWND
jgi:hypothetical protein